VVQSSNFEMLRAVTLATALMFSAAPAWALGGEASAESARFEGRTVMVLGSRGSVCSGSVLSPTVIITAGHCVSGAGQYAIAYREGGSPVLQEVRQVARHPGFAPGSSVSIDMALVRLKTALPSRFSAVALDDNAEDDVVGSRQTVAGFGLARDGDEASAGVLRTASVTILPRYFPRFMRLGRLDGSFRVCKGDSGGPVFSDGFTGVTLTAIIHASEKSRGSRQCGETAQAVRVAPQRGWIDSIRARWGE
jgi:secreted trypsin-like serine protease